MKQRIRMPLVAALISCAGASFAQPVPLDLHDDMSGTLKDQYTMKATTRYDRAGASLTFDIDYEYKASLLMGEPLQLCSARLSNPRGSVRFTHDGEEHTVQIDRSNASLLTPYNLDFAIAYRSVHSDNTHYLARCNTGIPGSWANDPMTVTGSPDWGDFLCWHGGRTPARPEPMPDSLGRDWCRTIGDAESRILDADEAKALFARTTGIFASESPADASGERPEPTMKARSVHVASLAVNYGDVVLAETKRLAAQKIAGRKLQQVEQIEKSLPWFPKGDAKQAGDILDDARNAAKAMSDPREQARRLQQAMRDVLAIENDSEPISAELKAIKDAIVVLLSIDDERGFMEAMKKALSDAQAARDEAAQSADAFLDSQREAAAAAPAFAFAGPDMFAGDTGPEDIEQEIARIDGHDGWPIRRVVFHPDGRRLLTAGFDNTVRFWDIASGTEIWRESGYRSNAITISRDGRFAVTGDDSGGVNVIDIETGTRVRRFTGHEYRVISVAVSPDGRYLYSGSGSRAFLMDFETGSVIKDLSQRGSISYGIFSADSSMLISLTNHSNVRWYSVPDGKSLGWVDISDYKYLALDPYAGQDGAFASEQGNVVTMTDEGWLHFLSRNSKYRVEGFDPIPWTAGRHRNGFSVSPDGRFVLLAEPDGSVAMRERSAEKGWRVVGVHESVRKKSESGTYADRYPTAVLGVAMSPDGKIAASVGMDGMIRIWGPKQR